MLTYKVKLMFDSQEIVDFWTAQMFLARDCYNYASKIVFEEKIAFSLKTFHHRLYREMREHFTNLPAQMCIKIYKQLLANYKSAKSNGHHLKKPIQMKKPSVQLDKRLYSNMTRDSFRISNGDSRQRSLVKFLTYPKFEEMASKYRMCDPLLKYELATGEFYACIPFLSIDTTPYEDSYVGVDLGMRRIATLSDGTAYTDKNYLAQRRKIRHNKRIFQKHKKSSHSARTKLKKLRNKERIISKEMCHKIANQIIKHHDASVIVMEDLQGIKETTSKTKNGFNRKGHNNRISQVPFFQLKQILTYKAPLAGKRVETVSPEYTSQEDCRTQSKVGCIRKGCRFYTADSRVFDADWNAAINIMNRYLSENKHPISLSLPLDGKLNLIGRLRQQANRRIDASMTHQRQAAASSARW
jgi:putative transposase